MTLHTHILPSGLPSILDPRWRKGWKVLHPTRRSATISEGYPGCTFYPPHKKVGRPTELGPLAVFTSTTEAKRFQELLSPTWTASPNYMLVPCVYLPSEEDYIWNAPLSVAFSGNIRLIAELPYKTALADWIICHE